MPDELGHKGGRILFFGIWIYAGVSAYQWFCSISILEPLTASLIYMSADAKDQSESRHMPAYA